MKPVRDLVPTTPAAMQASAAPKDPTKDLLETVPRERRVFGLDVMKVAAGALPRFSLETGRVWAYFVARTPDSITFDDWMLAIEQQAAVPGADRVHFGDLRDAAFRIRDRRLQREREPAERKQLEAQSRVQRVGCAQIGSVRELYDARSAGKITREEYDLATDEVFAGRPIPAELLAKMAPEEGEKEKEP